MHKERLTARLAEVKENGLYRRLRAVEGAQDAAVILEGQEVLLFSSNNLPGFGQSSGPQASGPRGDCAVWLWQRRFAPDFRFHGCPSRVGTAPYHT